MMENYTKYIYHKKSQTYTIDYKYFKLDYSDNLEPKKGILAGVLVEELVEILVGNKKNTFHLIWKVFLCL